MELNLNEKNKLISKLKLEYDSILLENKNLLEKLKKIKQKTIEIEKNNTFINTFDKYNMKILDSKNFQEKNLSKTKNCQLQNYFQQENFKELRISNYLNITSPVKKEKKKNNEDFENNINQSNCNTSYNYFNLNFKNISFKIFNFFFKFELKI